MYDGVIKAVSRPMNFAIVKGLMSLLSVSSEHGG